jgi:hypothetical protein
VGVRQKDQVTVLCVCLCVCVCVCVCVCWGVSGKTPEVLELILMARQNHRKVLDTALVW